MSTEKIPLVSVIIPMYNAEKFIPQTLESLLYQTMTDFEVIVVDDCSIDNSVEVVESFIPKFDSLGKQKKSAEEFSLPSAQIFLNNTPPPWGVKLNIIKLPKNTGTPGLPRNIGIQAARGKYIAFLDSDDLFTKTALEEFATLAEEYTADIVHTNGAFVLWQGEPLPIDNPAMTDMNELTAPKNLSFYTLRFSVAPPPTEPVFEVENLSERVKLWINWNYDWSTCTTFCKRDFIISNQIFFSAMKTSEDIPFNFKCLMRAKKYLSVPNVNYIIRPLEGSISRDNPNLAEHFHKRIGALNAGCNELDRIMKESDFFNRHYNYRYAVLEWFVNLRVAMLFKCCSGIPSYHLNYLVRKEFHTDDAAFASCLFNMVNLQRNIIEKLEAEIKELKSKE